MEWYESILAGVFVSIMINTIFIRVALEKIVEILENKKEGN